MDVVLLDGDVTPADVDVVPCGGPDGGGAPWRNALFGEDGGDGIFSAEVEKTQGSVYGGGEDGSLRC